MKKIILLLCLLILGIVLVAGCRAKKDDSGAGSASGKAKSNAVSVSEDLRGMTVSCEYPKENWFARVKNVQLEIHNVPTESDVKYTSPLVWINVQKGEKLDYYDTFKKDFKDLKDIPNKTIAGIDMKGRTYGEDGSDWIQYMGEIDSEYVVSIKITSSIDIESGDGKAILDSIKFKKAAE